jgi:myo-inositol-1(or 4)-monophosphatase
MAEVDHMGPTMELRTEPRTSKRRVDVAIEAAKAAGAVLRDIRETDLVVQEKDSSRTSIVTAADLRSQREIVRIIRRSCPNDMIIGEEGNDGESQTPSRWYVDPLDGTTNYAHRLPFYCTSITYCDTGGVGIGVVHDPLRDDLFVAVRGEGATRNGKRLVVTIRPPFDPRANAVTSRSISPASRTSIGLNSTPNDGGAVAWIAANWPIPEA